MLLRVEKGLDSRIPSVEEAKRHHYSKVERERIKQNRNRMIIGSPETVEREMINLTKHYQTEEFMVLTNLHSFEERMNSYKRLAHLFL